VLTRETFSWFGYLFVERQTAGDGTNYLVRSTGDSPITNTLVRLVAGGVTVASTNTDALGYYRFDDVPAGTVSILVSRASATLIDVPAAEPQASDTRRNRARPLGAEEAYIAHAVVSGYGVLTELPGEPLNFGFSSNPLSTALDLRVFADGQGGVRIEVCTVNESGYGDIVIYAWLGNAWKEVGRVAGVNVLGEGSNRYTVSASGLSADGAYLFKIVDESGHVHYTDGEVAVRSMRVAAVRLTMETLTLAFNTEPGRPYVVKVSTDLVHWTTEHVSYPTAFGWSDFENTPFTAGGKNTEVRVPVNRRRQAFFKIEGSDE